MMNPAPNLNPSCNPSTQLDPWVQELADLELSYIRRLVLRPFSQDRGLPIPREVHFEFEGVQLAST
jgi:hypothetical protein